MLKVASLESRFNQLTPRQMSFVARSVKSLEGNRYDKAEIRTARAVQAYRMISGEAIPEVAVSILKDLVAFDFKVS